MRHLRRRYRRRGHAYMSSVTYVVQHKTDGHWQDYSFDFPTSEAANEYRRKVKERGVPLSQTQVKMYLPGDER